MACLAEMSALLDEQELITFRWYAQQAELPVEQAKLRLLEYAKQHKHSVRVVYLVRGTIEAEGGQRRWQVLLCW